MGIVMNGREAISYGSVIHTLEAMCSDITIARASSCESANTRPDSAPGKVSPPVKGCDEFVILGCDSFGLTEAVSDCKSSTSEAGISMAFPLDESRFSRSGIGDRAEQACGWW